MLATNPASVLLASHLGRILPPAPPPKSHTLLFLAGVPGSRDAPWVAVPTAADSFWGKEGASHSTYLACTRSGNYRSLGRPLTGTSPGEAAARSSISRHNGGTRDTCTARPKGLHLCCGLHPGQAPAGASGWFAGEPGGSGEKHSRVLDLRPRLAGTTPHSRTVSLQNRGYLLLKPRGAPQGSSGPPLSKQKFPSPLITKT